MKRYVCFHVLYVRQCSRIGDGKAAEWASKKRVKILCNKRSEKTSKDLIRGSFLEIRALASLEEMLPRKTALLFFLEVCGKIIENRREQNRNGFTPCYDAHFYTFNLCISKTSLNLI